MTNANGLRVVCPDMMELEPGRNAIRVSRKPARCLRFATAILLGLGSAGSGTTAFAQADASNDAGGFDGPYKSRIEPMRYWGERGIGLGWAIQYPEGHYGSDHGNAMANTGFFLQYGHLRNDRSWAAYLTLTTDEVTSRPTVARNVNLKHNTWIFGADVHWRGSNPGAGYLIFGGGIAMTELIATGSLSCTGILPPLVGECHATDRKMGDKKAPYIQAGFGLDCTECTSHYFVEVLWWLGPYIKPVVSADGMLEGGRSTIGNAVRVNMGFRIY